MHGKIPNEGYLGKNEMSWTSLSKCHSILKANVFSRIVKKWKIVIISHLKWYDPFELISLWGPPKDISQSVIIAPFPIFLANKITPKQEFSL